MALEPTDRAQLRQFLVAHFSLEELKNLAFDLGVDFELFAHQTKLEFARGLIAYFERRETLSGLVTEILRQRHDEGLAQLLAKLPASTPSKKIQIIASEEVLEDVSSLLDELARKLKISRNEVALVGAAWGSARLLISVPEDTINPQALSGLFGLGEGQYEIVSIEAFDALDLDNQKAWRRAACDRPPVLQKNGLRPAISWQEALSWIRGGTLRPGRLLFRQLRPWLWGLGAVGGLVLAGLAVRAVLLQNAATPTPTLIATPVPTSTATVAATDTPVPPTATASPIPPTATAMPIPPGVTPSPTAIRTPTATHTPTPSVTPSPTTSRTPTPSATPSPTASHTPTPSVTPSPTPVPAAVPPKLVAPGFGTTQQNPVTFQWSGSLFVNEAYQVTAVHPQSGQTIQSGALTTQQWAAKLPNEAFGQWRWSVAVLRAGKVAAASDESMFWFNPFPSAVPTSPTPITVTPTVSPASPTLTPWTPIPSPTS
jgi:hypothetical protein